MKRNDYLFIMIVGLFILLRLPYINLPFFCDEIGFYVRAVWYMQHHIISLLPGDIPAEYSRGHPLLFIFLYSFIVKIFGYHIYLLHGISLIISVGVLWATYIISKQLFHSFIALAVVILLAIQPVFLAQSMMVLPEMTLTLFATLSLHYFIQRKKLYYFFTCSLAILTKESAIILPFTLFAAENLWLIVNECKLVWKNIKITLWAFLPITVFVGFFLIQKIQNGWFFFPVHVNMMSFYYKDIFTKLIHSSFFLFIKQGRFLWAIIFALFIYKWVLIIYHKNRLPPSYRTILVLGLFSIGTIAFSSVNFCLNRYLLYAIPALSIAVVFCLQILLIKRNQFLIALVILCITSVYFERSNTLMYDENLAYTCMVSVHQQGVAYLEEHHLNYESVLANSSISDELKYTHMGYLKNGPFTNVHTNLDDDVITHKVNIKWCIIDDPASFDFNSLPFKLKAITTYKSSFAETGIYQVIE